MTVTFDNKTRMVRIPLATPGQWNVGSFADMAARMFRLPVGTSIVSEWRLIAPDGTRLQRHVPLSEIDINAEYELYDARRDA